MAIFSWTKSKKSRAFLEFRPYSAFTFGGRNRKPKAENFRFWPKVSASGIPLVCTVKWSYFRELGKPNRFGLKRWPLLICNFQYILSVTLVNFFYELQVLNVFFQNKKWILCEIFKSDNKFWPKPTGNELQVVLNEIVDGPYNSIIWMLSSPSHIWSFLNQKQILAQFYVPEVYTLT